MNPDGKALRWTLFDTHCIVHSVGLSGFWVYETWGMAWERTIGGAIILPILNIMLWLFSYGIAQFIYSFIELYRGSDFDPSRPGDDDSGNP